MVNLRKFFKATCVLLCGFILVGWSLFGDEEVQYPPIPKEINKKTFCAKDGEKFGHTVVLIDTTTPLDKARIDFIKSEVFGAKFFESFEPFTKFSYILINNTPTSSQKYVFSKCRPKSGKKTLYSEANNISELESKYENIKNVKKYWLKFNRSAQLSANKIFSSKETAEYSLIYESTINVLQNKMLDFGSDYPKRNLIIVTDLMQNSERISFYDLCKSKFSSKADLCPRFKDIMKDMPTQEYFQSTTESLDKKINIKLLYINHRSQTKFKLDQSLLKLWMDYFEHYNYQKPEVKRMLDTK
jgi:hypothetical protein